MKLNRRKREILDLRAEIVVLNMIRDEHQCNITSLTMRIIELEKVNRLLMDYLGVERIKPNNQDVIRKRVSRKTATKK